MYSDPKKNLKRDIIAGYTVSLTGGSGPIVYRKARDESSLTTNLQLKKRNLDINKSKSLILFDEQTPSGEKIKIKSNG